MADVKRFVGYEVSTNLSAVQAVTRELGRPVHIQNIGNGKAVYYYENPEYEFEWDEPQGLPDSHRDIVENAEEGDLLEVLEGEELENAESSVEEDEEEASEEEEGEGEETGAATAGVSRSRGALEDETKTTLYEIASDMEISGRSRMSKDELVDAILAAE